jgi:hypothetical protein
MRRKVVWAALVVILGVGRVADARPDLRQGRVAGPLTVYPDDARPNLFYYAPGELAIAQNADGTPDVHFMHVRYTGNAASGDRGTVLLRSTLNLRVVMAGPSPADIRAAQQALRAIGRQTSTELRPLPIRRLDSALVYTPVSTDPGAVREAPAPTTIAAGHFDQPDKAKVPAGAFWNERVYNLPLEAADAQLLDSAFKRGQVAMSVGYAFYAEGIGADQPLTELTGSTELVGALRDRAQPPSATADTKTDPTIHLVRAGALAVTLDLSRWPQLVRRVDINDAIPPGYAALDVYCHDFVEGLRPELYEKQVQVEAQGVAGGQVMLTATFSRSQPDLSARSLRFPVAVRLDRPYRFRTVEIKQDGTSVSGAWQTAASWSAVLDVTTRPRT